MNTLYTSLIIGLSGLLFYIVSLLSPLRHRYYLLQARLSKQPFVEEQVSFLSDCIR
jgi:hypothetical protein